MTTFQNAILHFQSGKAFNQTIQLTGSKSECNRALILAALSKGLVNVENISEAADTVTLQQVLASQIQDGATIDIGPAGTAMRFLTAFLATQKGSFVLTGSARMKQRPIGILVDALKNLGAKIQYTENEGFPPLKIEGNLENFGHEVHIQGNVSSQYLSALLLIAPTLPKGLKLHIEGELTSKPYLEMTLAMLNQVGISHQWENQRITIPAQEFKAATLTVEPDWSAASYWYSICALVPNSVIHLPYLQQYSLQGDQAIVEIMAHFGVHTTFHEKGITLTNEGAKITCTHFDFVSCPDLAQTVIVCAAALGYPLTFSGLHTLRIKETDRILALQQELAKFNIQLNEKENELFELDCSGKIIPHSVQIATYEDHRMAMAFAPLAVLYPNIQIEDPQVVEKSYPSFWKDLAKIGITTQKS